MPEIHEGHYIPRRMRVTLDFEPLEAIVTICFFFLLVIYVTALWAT